MKIYKYPKRELWGEIIERPRLDLSQLNATVSSVLADVKQRGDAAVKEYEEKFDKAVLTSLAVTEQEILRLHDPDGIDRIHLSHEKSYPAAVTNTLKKRKRAGAGSPPPTRHWPRVGQNDRPLSIFSAPRYLSRVFRTISSGSSGAGGVLSQSSDSR